MENNLIRGGKRDLLEMMARTDRLANVKKKESISNIKWYIWTRCGCQIIILAIVERLRMFNLNGRMDECLFKELLNVNLGGCW